MPTLSGQIAERNHGTSADGVRAFERTTRELGEPVVRTISERQWERWCAGKVRSRRRPAACRVLEAMTGRGIDELLAVAPAPVPERISGIDPRGLLHMATRSGRGWISQAEASSAGPETLAQIRAELGVLAQACPREPLPTILRVGHAIQAPALAGAAETATAQGEIEEFTRRRMPVLPQ